MLNASCIVNTGIVFSKCQPELNRCGVPEQSPTWQPRWRALDDLGVRTKGDMQRRPLITDLLTAGEGRRREIRIHYYSCIKGNERRQCGWAIVSCEVIHKEGRMNVSILHAGVYNASVFPAVESSYFFWLIILLNPSLGNTHLQSGNWTLLSGLLQVSRLTLKCC